MKKLFVNLIFTLVTLVAHAQFPAPQPPPLNKDMIRVGKLFWLNTSDTTEFPASSYRGAIMYRTADKSLYVSDSTRWVKVASGGDLSEYMKFSDTTSLSTRIDEKLNISDTLSMLYSYLRIVDTTGKWKPLGWFPVVSEVTGLQDSLSDRFTKDQSDARYLQGNQTITLSGDVLGSGTTGISTTLKNTGTAGTYTKVTTDAQGRVTSGTTLSSGDIPNLSATYIPVTQKGAANGVATLGGDGKVTPSQLPVTGGGFLGQWNASTNTPTLADGVGSPGEYYRVSTAGTVDLGSGSQTFAQGDAVVYTAAGEWIKDPNYQAVSSVNGKVGAVVIDKGDVGLPLADNTSDLAKPISTATQTALNGKEATIAPGTTAQYWRGDKTWQTLSTAVRPLFSAGTGLTYNSSTGAFAANFGTTAGTVAQGNDSRINNGQTAFGWGNHTGLYVPLARTITAGTGLTGGGDLTANRSFVIDPAYASFTNYYTKTNLQTSGQAAVHWGNLTNVPGSFPTTSNLQTVLANGNTATNSITLGINGTSTQYVLNLIRRVSSVDYTGGIGVGGTANTAGVSIYTIDASGTHPNRLLYVPSAFDAPRYSPDGGINSYAMWHSNNHPAGSAFTPTLTGANVLSSLTVNSAGHVSALTTRALTAGDISAAPASGSGNYIQNQLAGVQSGSGFFVSGRGISNTAFEVRKAGSNSKIDAVNIYNADASRGGTLQLNGDANPGLATWIHNGSSWVKRQEYFADGTATFYSALTIQGATSLQNIPTSGSAASIFLTTGGGGQVQSRTAAQVRSDIGAQAAGSYVNLQGATPGTAQTGHINISGTLTASAMTAPSGNDLSISAPASHSLFFNPGGTNRGVWDGDGRLGIGTTPNSVRASLLEVNGNVWATDAYILGTTNSPTAEFGLSGGGTNGSAFLRTMGTGNLSIQTGASNTRIQINGTTGNVGIGTAATAYNLTVAGDVSFAGSNFTVNALGQTVIGGTVSADGEITANGGLEIGTFGQLTIPQGAGAGKVLTSDASGNASWQVPGQKMNVTARQTGNYTVGASDQVVLLNPSGSGFTLTLPSAASSTGRVLWVRNLNTGTTPVNSSVSIIGEGGTITAFPAQLTLQIISDGTDWIQIGK